LTCCWRHCWHALKARRRRTARAARSCCDWRSEGTAVAKCWAKA
jgi:hypothetical protein